MKLKIMGAMLASFVMLTACGNEADTGVTEASPSAEIVKARQANFRVFGGSMKSLSEQMRSSTPDFVKIREASNNMIAASEGMANWFPEGSGPESGLKTDAKAEIWVDRTDFDTKIAAFNAAQSAFSEAVSTENIVLIQAAFGGVGPSCKACHDKYKAD